MKLSLQLFCVGSVVSWILLSSPALFAETETAITAPNYGWLLVKTGFVLVGLCLTAYIGLKYLSKVNVGSQGPMKILGRLPIDGRRSVMVIDVAGKTLIVGNSESGMTTLGELDTKQRAQFNVGLENKTSFKELLGRSKEIVVKDEPGLVEEEA